MNGELRCREYTVEGDPFNYFVNNWAAFLPFGSLESYGGTDPVLRHEVGRLLTASGPSLTLLYYEEPELPKHGVQPLPCHYEEWARHLTKLTGTSDVCFMSQWNLIPRYYRRQLPPSYRGRIIQRGSHPDIPVLVEITEELTRDAYSFSAVWHIGTWGYILPATDIDKLAKWAAAQTITPELVRDFFATVKLMFQMWYEVDCIKVLSLKMSTSDLCKLLRGDE